MNVQNELVPSLLKPQYKVQKKLGEGGMGQVYLAIDMVNRRPVAIKSISFFHKDDQLVQRLSREYRILQMIDHPNVVKAYEFFEENGQMFLVMEFILGISMKEYIQTNPNPPLLEKLAISNQLCRAVEVLNTTGILHRDLKPANIMVNKATGNIKLLDMGLGKKMNPSKESMLLTQEGDIIGTTAYLSPEQIKGKFSEKSDVFALGIVLYQIFAWLKLSPFQAENSLSTMLKIAEGEIADLNSQIQEEVSDEERRIYQEVSAMVSRALIKDVGRRLSTAKEMGDEMERLYQELKMSRCFGGEPSRKDENYWKTTASISIEELKKYFAIKEEYEKENKKGEIDKTPRRNKTKFGMRETSWIKRLIAIGILCVLCIPIVLSFVPSENQKTQEKPEKKKISEEKKSEKPALFLSEEIWSKCKYLHEGQWILDTTTDTWCALSPTEQMQYAAAYQQKYAREKNLDLEKIIIRRGTDFVMRLIPPGCFWMGSKEVEIQDIKNFWKETRLGDYSETRRCVVIPKAFWMQKTEITQRQWKAIVGTTPWSGRKYMEENEQWPAGCISWNDIKTKFLPWMGKEFALPTEEQWEYACRAGTTSQYYWGESENELGEYANCMDLTAKESRKYAGVNNLAFMKIKDGHAGIAPVQSLKPNGYGLYDMAGNLWEWCEDLYGKYPPTDKKSFYRVVRGGSWCDARAWSFRSSLRVWGVPTGNTDVFGFRIVLLDVH